MRYYSHEELKEVISYYIQYWLGNTESSDEENLVLTKLDLNVALDTNLARQAPVKLKDFLSKYKLLVNNYFKESTKLINDLDKNTKEDQRYPLIVIYTHETGEPDMFVLTEYETVINNLDSKDLEVIVIDKIKYPVNEELFKKFAKYYKIKYDPAVYRK